MKTANIILPTYNESGNISQLIQRLRNVEAESNPDYQFEILVVDDRSPDGTAEVVSQIQKRTPRIHLIRGRKQGLGKAYLRGFKHALKKIKPDVVVMMDADLSHNPESVPKLLAGIESGGDYVIGSRYTHGGAVPGNWSLWRIINSRVANFIATRIGGIDATIKDITGGFKAIKVSALKEISLQDINIYGYAFQMRLLHEFTKNGFKVVEVPIVFYERHQGESKIRPNDIIEFLKCAYQLSPDSPFKQVLRFGLVGLSGLLVNLGVLFILRNYSSLPLLFSSAIAIEVSIISNFVLHSIYTFRRPLEWANSQKPKHAGAATALRRLRAFNLATLGVAGITLAVFAFLHRLLGAHYLIAQSAAVGMAFVINYWVSKNYVWRAS